MSAGCGVSAPDIAIAATCAVGSIPIQLERGVSVQGPRATVCQVYAGILAHYRTTYEEGWGTVPLVEEDWTLRVRAGEAVDSDGHTGATYHRSRIIDISERSPETLPHELRHAQLGRGSDDHHGWCTGFEQWEERVLGVDERDYLGCTR